MSYTLQAIVALSENLATAIVAGTSVAVLDNGIAMLPLTSRAQEILGVTFLPLTDNEPLDEASDGLCRQLSQGCRLAYIEADFFGGSGLQGAVLFEHGESASEIILSKTAINQALEFLGVRAMSGMDAFDTVGLGRHRSSDDWVGEGAI